MARRPVSVKHPHVGLLEVWCLPSDACRPRRLPTCGRAASGVRFAKRMASRKRVPARGSTHGPENAPAGRPRVVRRGRRRCPKRAVCRASDRDPNRRWARRRFPPCSLSAPHPRPGGPPGDTVRKESRDTPPVAGGVPAPNQVEENAGAARHEQRLARPGRTGLINVTCSAPGGGACRWRSASAGGGSSPTARSAWLPRTPASTVAPRLRSAHRKRRALPFGMRSPSDTGRGALRRDAPNVSPVSRLPWGAPYTRVNP